MSRRAVVWIVALAVADVVVFLLTLHAHETYHRTANGPSVMPLGQLLGWALSVALLFAIIVVILGSRQATRYGRYDR